jgi:hypothetical protein
LTHGPTLHVGFFSLYCHPETCKAAVQVEVLKRMKLDASDSISKLNNQHLSPLIGVDPDSPGRAIKFTARNNYLELRGSRAQPIVFPALPAAV